jgi:hypothetical protein
LPIFVPAAAIAGPRELTRLLEEDEATRGHYLVVTYQEGADISARLKETIEQEWSLHGE